MCWKTNKKEECVGKIAENNIMAYKIMVERNGRLYSWISDFLYNVGESYKCNKKVKPMKCNDDLWIINEGFHSYNFDSTFITEENDDFVEKKWCVRSKNNRTTIISYIVPDQVVRKIRKINCIIPKGSIYYENKYGEIVSDQIIITNN